MGHAPSLTSGGVGRDPHPQPPLLPPLIEQKKDLIHTPHTQNVTGVDKTTPQSNKQTKQNKQTINQAKKTTKQ